MLRGVAARIFVIGGQDAAGTVLDIVEEYTNATVPTLVGGARTPLPAPRARFGIGASRSANQIYVAGGIDGAGADQTTVFEYTIANNGPVAGPPGTPSGAWVTRANLPAARRSLQLTTPPGVTNFLTAASAGRDPRQDAIAAWIAARVHSARAPVPPTDPGAMAGRTLFGTTGLVVAGFSCATCHGGPKWTRSTVAYAAPPSPADNVGMGNENVIGAELRKTIAQPGVFPGVLVNVGTFTLGGGRVNEIRADGADVSRAIAPLGANGFNIPSLLSVHETAPYFYSGLAATLAQVLDGSQDGNGGTRHHFVANPADRANLIAFLRSIDETTPPFPPQEATTTTLASSANPSVFGQPVTLTATVTAPGGGIPGGTVAFRNGAALLGVGTLNAAGQASLNIASPPPGNYSIRATHNGNGSFAPSISPTLNQVVSPAGTTTTLTSSVNPSDVGQPLTFTATVTASAPGSGTPTGSVTFFDGGTNLGTSALDCAGVAAFVTSSLAPGLHPITATSNPDPNFTPGTSPALNQIVGKLTATTLTANPNPSTFNQPVSFTATVTTIPPGAAVPVGNVSFEDVGTGTPLGTAALNAAGAATLMTNTLTVGTHPITATYNAQAQFAGSVSPQLQQVVLADSDGDGTPDPNDGCPADPAKTALGACGCGVADTDSDHDGTPDCNEACPNDPAKTAAGVCGCGRADTDANRNGVADCIDPTIGPCPGNITVTATGPDGIAVDFMLPAGSSPIGAASVSSNPPAGSILPVGVTPVTVTVTDIHGVRASCTFTVTVNPPAAPPAAQPAPPQVDRDALRLLLSILFRAPICGTGFVSAMPLMILGLMAAKRYNRIRRRRR